MLRRLVAMVLALSLCITLAAGCTPAKKPAPAPKTPPSKVVPKAKTPATKTPAPKTAAMPTTPAGLNSLAKKLAGEAAKAKGVKTATVALSGTTAYVGLDLNANITGAKTDAVKKDAADRVKKADKRLTNVYVTSDVGIVTRIKNVATGIGKGKPISSFAAQLAEIGRRINPKKK